MTMQKYSFEYLVAARVKMCRTIFSYLKLHGVSVKMVGKTGIVYNSYFDPAILEVFNPDNTTYRGLGLRGKGLVVTNGWNVRRHNDLMITMLSFARHTERDCKFRTSLVINEDLPVKGWSYSHKDDKSAMAVNASGVMFKANKIGEEWHVRFA